MLKIINLWTLSAGFVGLLIFGAINLTSAKIGDDNGFQAGIAVERGAADNPESG